MVFWSDEYDVDELHGFHVEQENAAEDWIMQNIGRIVDDLLFDHDGDEDDDDMW